jgi:hypothetical protein
MPYKYKHSDAQIRELYDRVAKDKDLLSDCIDIARNNSYDSRVSEICKVIREVYTRWSHDQIWELSIFICIGFQYNKKNYYKDDYYR